MALNWEEFMESAVGPLDRHTQDPTPPYLQMQIYMQTTKPNLTFPTTKQTDFHNKK